MRVASAYSSGICFNRSESKAAAGENLLVCLVHVIVTLVKTLEVPVKGIGVLHYKLSAAHETESRSCFVSVFGLYLIEVHRQLPV